MDLIAREVEPSLGYRHQLPEAGDAPSVGNAMSNAACDLAEALRAAAILVPTFSGRTASMVARLRPRRPIVGLSHHQYALQQMALEWGVTPLLIPESPDVEDLWNLSIEAARDAGIVRDRRPRRDHGRDAGQHPRLDERDQGRHRVGTGAFAAKLRRMAKRSRKRATRSRLFLRWAIAAALCLVAVAVLPPGAHVPAHARHGLDASGGGPEAARAARAARSGSSRRRRATRSSRARRAGSASSSRASSCSSSRASTAG